MSTEQAGVLVADVCCPVQHAKQLADTIREKVKALGYERHKLVVQVRAWAHVQAAAEPASAQPPLLQVTLAQKKGQAIRIASRCLWDATNDTYASCVYENESLLCNCQVRHCLLHHRSLRLQL